MKSYLGWIFWLLMALACDAAEIVAWKVPLDRFAEGGLESTGIVRCKSAPEPSPFFKPGDVLWDLKGIPAKERMETDPPLEWAVWNENSERLVIKADWNGIWQLHQRLNMESPENPGDLFATQVPKELPKPRRFKEVMVPEILKPWIDRPVWNLQEWMRNLGIELKDGSDFAGYDPLTQKIFILSNSENLLDLFEQLYSPGCMLRPVLLFATFDGNGQTRLGTRSGLRGSLKRSTDNQKETRVFEIEPVLGESDDMVDIHLNYRDDSVSGQKQSLKTAVTLKTGCPLEIISGSTGDAKKSSLRLKAEVIRVP